jgi:Ca2+-binding RTX toxin-like protein
MHNTSTWYGYVTNATSTNITITDYYRVASYGGYGFTYSGNTVVGGTLTSFVQYEGGYLTHWVTGAAVDAKLAASLIQSNNLPTLFSIIARGNDTILGSDYGDVLDGFNGNDYIKGWGGNDQIYGSDGNDTLNGMEGNDYLIGGAGNDTLSGGNGNDKLIGGIGIDKLIGGNGIDTLAGGANNDIFVFNAPRSAANRDVITDFNHVADTFHIENAVFTHLGAGVHALASGMLRLGTKALDRNDFLIYNKANGVLSYDHDANGADAAITIATLTNHPVLAANDFLVI